MSSSIDNLLEVSPQKKAASRMVQLLAEAICLGKFEVGDRIPSERKLSEYYDAPLHAVRLAIGQLKDDAILESRPKSGVYVIDEPDLDYGNFEKPAASEKPVGRASRPPFPGNEPDLLFRENDNNFPSRNLANNSPSTFQNAPSNQGKAQQIDSIDGFSLIGRPLRTKTTLHFAIAGWYSGNKPLWEKACAEYELESGGRVEIVPHFPSNFTEYESLQQSCGIFIGVHHNLAAAGLEHLVTPVDINILQNAGVQQRYIDAVHIGEGKAIGMPISATLLMGFLDTKILSKENIKKIEAAQDMIAGLDILSNVAKSIDQGFVFNLCPETCFNTMQMLFAQAGGLLGKTNSQLDLSSPPACDTLYSIDSFLKQTEHLPGDNWRFSKKDSALLIDYIPNTERLIKSHRYKPWAYPLTDSGKYLEGLNIGMVSSHCPYPQEAAQFLSYLVSPQVQQYLLSTGRGYSVSSQVDNPFAPYPKEHRKIMKHIQQRAIVDGEFVPGYSKMLHEVFYPAARLWFSGKIKAGDFINIVEQRGNAHLKRAAHVASAASEVSGQATSGQATPEYQQTIANNTKHNYFENDVEEKTIHTMGQPMALA